MANENMIKFLRGNVANLPQTATSGALYFTKDEGIYLGMEDGSYHRYGDFITVADVNSLPATGAHATCMYYCTKENILARYDSEKGWIQINKQPTAEEMKTLLGLGSAAYTDATAYDAAGSAQAVRTYVGDIPNDENGDPMAASVIAYINKKTDGIATSGNLEALGARVTTAEGEIDALQEASAKHVEKVDGKSLVADTEITKLAGVSEGANKVEKSETNGNIKVDGEEVVVYTHPDKHAIGDVTGLQDALDGLQAKGDYAAEEHTHVVADITDLDDTIKGYDYATKTELGDVDKKFANYKTAANQKEIDDEQDRRLGVIEGDYLKAADITDFETKENVKKVSDELGAYKTSNDAAVALKADKSVVEAMYTNDQIDGFIAEVKKYADDNDADTKYGLVYDSDSKKIKLVEGGSEVEIDATDFIKDGMIETVTIGDDNDLVITFNTAAGKENIILPLDQLVDIYTGIEGARVKVTVASDKSISADLVAGSISKNYLDEGVQVSLAKADSALQEHQDISHLATTEALNGVDAKFANYTNTTDMNTKFDLKANATDVYAKTETFTRDEVNAAIAAAVETAHTWGEF